jgi:SEC-C motif-containing protein
MKDSLCPCQSGKEYSACCEPILTGKKPAPTAEALMRSRYSAFVTGHIDYLEKSLHPDHREGYDHASTKKWAAESEWLGLQIIQTREGGEKDQKGEVEFAATFRQKGEKKPLVHHEIGCFSRKEGHWYYVDGKSGKEEPIRNEGPKIGRNDNCPCGSGKKYKKCCQK